MWGDRRPRLDAPGEGVEDGLGIPSVGLRPPSLLSIGDIGLRIPSDRGYDCVDLSVGDAGLD